MVILGIESTAHTASVGIVGEKAEVLGLASDFYQPRPAGSIPGRPRTTTWRCSRPSSGRRSRPPGSGRARSTRWRSPRDPGLGPCLRAGATVARMLSLAWDRPLVPVNHCVAHVEIARVLSGLDDPLLLYASGGNTQVIAYARGRYRVLGETLDIGIGNFLDKLWIGLGGTFPGGPAIEAEARQGTELLPLPFSVHGMDVAFSGMLTAALALHAKGAKRPDLAYSVEVTAYSMLTEITERALAHRGRDAVVLGGGVACNGAASGDGPRDGRRVAEAEMFAPPRSLCVDNGAMIAWTGLLALKQGATVAVEQSHVDPRQRTDRVTAPWRGPSEPEET